MYFFHGIISTLSYTQITCTRKITIHLFFDCVVSTCILITKENYKKVSKACQVIIYHTFMLN